MEVTYALFGDYHVGKTSFLIRHQTGEFTRYYSSTNNISTRILDYDTTFGEIRIVVTENHLNEDCEGIIVMFDMINYDSYHYSREVIQKFNKMCPNTPIIWVANKSDIATRKVYRKEVERKMDKLKVLAYVEISVANGDGINSPFEYLLRDKMGDIDDMNSNMEESDDTGDMISSITLNDHE